MAFTIGSLANNAMQLQMQQMLGNLAAAANGINTTSSAVSMPPQATMMNMPGSSKENKQVVPMDLEMPTENGGKPNPAPTPGRENGTVPMMPTENMFINVGIPSTSFPIIHTGILDPTLLNLQMMQQMGHAQTVPPPTVTTPSQQQAMNQTLNPLNQTNGTQMAEKGVIQFKSCSLHPPGPGIKPTTRVKPNGCRTIFVGGLPDNMTEAILLEIFETCGEITTLRLSKKNFCHIRFSSEASVEAAITYSGFRVRIGNSTESPNCGRLHVDYAQARDDQYDYECKLRQSQREQRHREKVSKERISTSLSPTKTVHFSENEAVNLTERIKNDETLAKASQILVNWLERGDCNKKNSNTIYSLIQSVNSQIRRLFSEKAANEQELRDAKDRHKRKMQDFKASLTQIQKVFNSASHQKVWDHFTKAQRKNIDAWKKALESKVEEDDDEVMEISDDEYQFTAKRSRLDTDKLKEENDSLRCQLRACKSEIYHLRCEGRCDHETKEKQINVLQETIRNLQTQLLANKAKEQNDTKKIKTLEERLKKANVKELLMKTKIAEASKLSKDTSSGKESEVDESEVEKIDERDDFDSGSDTEDVQIIETKSPDVVIASDDDDDDDDDHDSNETEIISKSNGVIIKDKVEMKSKEPDMSIVDRLNSNETKSTATNTLQLTETTARVISLATIFLMIQPTGALFENIFSYVKQSIDSLSEDTLRGTLKYYNTIFRQELKANNNGDDDSVEIWKYVGFVINNNKDDETAVNNTACDEPKKISDTDLRDEIGQSQVWDKF